MTKREFAYPSRDGATRIHAIEWIPEGEITGILQICHGMVEYIDRYDEFARYLADRGIYVVGHDHLGHGKSVCTEEDHGHFDETKGNSYVLGDIHVLRQRTMKKYPGIPYFILGHSMGSFLVRQYLPLYGQGLAGAIVMGTGSQPMAVLAAGQLLCRILAAVKGWRYRSRLIDEMCLGVYRSHFKETGGDWVTSDRELWEKYASDPLCNFRFTLGGYYQMLEGMRKMQRPGSLKRIPKDLPIFFVSGEDDPVGAFGKNVRKVCKKYRAAGLEHVELQLYRDDRHEILNETDRDKVYEDLYLWITENLQ